MTIAYILASYFIVSIALICLNWKNLKIKTRIRKELAIILAVFLLIVCDWVAFFRIRIWLFGFVFIYD